MPHRILLWLMLVAYSSLSSAQPGSFRKKSVTQKVTLYYNGAAEITSPEKASMKRMVELNLDAMVFHGVYQDFDLNDNLIAEGYFHEGKKIGLRTEYFKDHSLKSSIEFSTTDFIIWQLKNEAKESVVTNGSGKFSIPFFYGTGTTLQPRWKQGTLEGEFRFGKRMGTWNYFDLAKNKIDEEVYENGKFVKRIHYENEESTELSYPKVVYLSLNNLIEEVFSYDKQLYSNVNKSCGQQITYPVKFSRSATFAGGLKRLLLFIAQRIVIPDNAQVVIQLSIDNEGFVTSSAIQQGVSRQLDAACLESINNVELKFFPAIKKGKPYSSLLYVPIYGGAAGLKLIEDLPYDFTPPDN